MALRSLRADGTEVMPGDAIISRAGEVWFYHFAVSTTTTKAFGKIAVSRVPSTRHDPLESVGCTRTFADFAFSLTVRG